jgi:hypothetical protein
MLLLVNLILLKLILEQGPLQNMFLNLMLLINGRHAPHGIILGLLIVIINEENTGIIRSIY